MLQAPPVAGRPSGWCSPSMNRRPSMRASATGPMAVRWSTHLTPPS